MRVLAIIPARGGSKGIPRKNLQLLDGKPLVGRSVELARGTPGIERVVVSTDDPEIGRTARSFGADVVWRPADLSGDTASSELALLHTLAHFEQAEGYTPDVVVFLQCTAPLTAPEDVAGTLRQVLEEGADSALAAVPFHYFLWRQTPEGGAVGVNHEASRRPLRQEREPQYLETGAVYAMRADGFRRARHRFFGKTALYVMPVERWLEIDEPADLVRAEIAWRHLRRAEGGTPGPER